MQRSSITSITSIFSGPQDSECWDPEDIDVIDVIGDLCMFYRCIDNIDRSENIKLGVVDERYQKSKNKINTYKTNIKQTHHAVAPLWSKVCEGSSQISMLRTSSKRALKTRCFS